MASLRPDPDHEAVLASGARHLVVTAPPGTGKTCLAVRLAGQLAPTLRPEARVLLLTFSNQARTQLEREAARHLPPHVRAKVEITNYHRFFWFGVRAHVRALGLPHSPDIGSHARRSRALARVDAPLVTRLDRTAGLIESLAEHEFPQFRDHRTPDAATLDRLLAVVHEEQQAGRLVFDDLGALFWSLIERFPVLDRAYRARYPVVIADEHQDASALQDAVARRLGQERLVVFADPMQLIHEFRGASRDRLDRHMTDCDERRELRTAHRWHGSQELAEWLLAVRARLEGEDRPGQAPPQLTIRTCRASHGFNAVKTQTRYAVSSAFSHGARTVAVLTRRNDRGAELRSYLSQQGMYPRQIGTEDFEDARVDVEQLPLLQDPRSIALHAVARLIVLLPTVDTTVWTQVRRRLCDRGVDVKRANVVVADILKRLEPLYSGGPAFYFDCVVSVLAVCSQARHHMPRIEAVRALRVTAQAIRAEPGDLDLALKRYASVVAAAAHTAPRIERGLLVMTAHQAKGKEFDAVILADGSAAYWPDTPDSRRLLYVAITRATRFWTIVVPDSGASPLVDFLT